MADEQLIQKQIGKQKIIKNEQNLAHAPIIKKEKTEIKTKENIETKENEPKEKKKEAKKPEVKVIRKYESSIYGRQLPISLRQSKAIGKFIKKKKIEDAIHTLEMVVKKKIAVPMTGEFAHKKGKGMMSGKYPVNASKAFIKLLKSLNTNSIANGMALENTIISEIIANKAPARMHRFGRTRFKQTHIMIKAKEIGGKK